MKKLDRLLKWLKSSKSVFGIIGFLLGRSVFFSAFNPFILAYVTAFFNRREFYPVAFMSVIGLLTVGSEINVFRYIFAIAMLTLFNLTNNKDTMTSNKIAMLCGLSVFSGGIIYTLFCNMAVYFGLMAVMETVLAVTLYFVIKDNIGIFNFFDISVIQSESYSVQVRNIISQKLKKTSDIFSKIYRTYNSSVLLEIVDENEAVFSIANNINDNVCKHCPKNSLCWNNNVNNRLYLLINRWLEDGFVKAEKMFSGECIKSGEVYMLSKGCVEMYRFNKLWLGKVEKSKLLAGRQLKVVSELLDDLCKQTQTGFNIDNELSNKLYRELTGFVVNSVVVCSGKRGYEIYVDIPHYYSCNMCGKDIISHINEILGVNMIKENSRCRVKNNNCLLSLVEEPTLKVAAYSASLKKENSDVTGDCYTYMEIDNGKYLLALADGMGSGNSAREESAASIEMYEDFMEAGFDRDMALDIINSVMFTGNENNRFSTLDICTIDLYSGMAEFVKIGAVSAFIVRDDKIELIKSAVLPVGIVGDIDTSVVSKQLYEGDIIVMVTDGVIDSTGNIIRNEKWLSDLIRKNRNQNPKKLSQLILDKAKENSHNTVRDDMTVLVAEIY